MDLTFYRNWLAFFLLGTINNLPYVVINSSAKVLATSFGQEQMVTLIMFANVSFGMLARGTNLTLSLIKCPFWIRFLINGCLMTAGLLGVAFAPNFWVALILIVVVGGCSSFGENLTLGYLQNLPKELVNAWSSGTGMAGLFGALLYIALACIAQSTLMSNTNPFYFFDPTSTAYIEHLKNINKFVYIGTTPAVLVYWFAYFILIKVPKPNDDEHVESNIINNSVKKEQVSLIQSTHSADSSISTHEGTFHRLFRCFKLTFWLSLNLMLVYIFEYCCQGLSAKSRPPVEYYISEVHCPELYASLQLCYQAGVFVSRSSVQLFQLRRVEIVTVLQFINLVIWFLQAWFKFLPVYILPGFMVYVGLLGGLSYVNIFYLLRSEPKYPDKDRELCNNIAGIWVNVGILLGTASLVPLFDTVMKSL